MTQVSFISPILSIFIFVHDGRRLAFCMRRIPKKKKEKTKRSKRNQAMWLKRPARWKMLQNKAVAWKRTREKKQSPVVLFSERHRRQRLAKLYTWVKLRQQQQQQKNRKQKQPTAKRRRVNKRRGIWTCETSLRLRYNERKKRMEKDTHNRWATSNSNNRKATIRKHCTIRSK